VSPTLDEAMRMAERGKQMAATVRELHSDDEPEQLAIFEDMPITEYRGSLAAGGFIKLDQELAPGTRVTITSEGYVSKVTFVKRKGKDSGRRQHVIVVEADSTKITKA